MAEFKIDAVSICSSFDIDEGQNLTDYLEDISNLDAPEPLRNRFVEIDEDDEAESQLGIGPINGGNPLESSMNYLKVDKWDDGECHVHVEYSSQYTDSFHTLYSDILELAGELTVHALIYRISIDKPFEDLNLGIDVTLPDVVEQDIHQVTGARFDLGDEDSDYLFQKSSSSSDSTQLRYGTGPAQLDGKSPESLIETELEDAAKLIGGL